MSAKDHPLQTSGLKTDGLEGQGARHRYPCDAARPRQRRFCLSIRIAPYRTHSRSTMHEASPAASFIHVRPSRPRLNRATCSSARPLRIRGADQFALSGSPVLPALVSATHVVSRRSLERWPDCVRGQCQFGCAWRRLRSASTPCTPPATDRGTAGDFE